MTPNNYFEECHKCKPPKRQPGCHAICPEYAKGKALLEADKAKAAMGKDIKYYINDKLNGSKDSVAKYAKRRPRRFHHK